MNTELPDWCSEAAEQGRSPILKFSQGEEPEAFDIELLDFGVRVQSDYVDKATGEAKEQILFSVVDTVDEMEKRFYVGSKSLKSSMAQAIMRWSEAAALGGSPYGERPWLRVRKSGKGMERRYQVQLLRPGEVEA